MMNLSAKLRNIEQLTPEENQQKFEEDIDKRVLYYINKLQENEDLIEKTKGKEEKLSEIGVEAFKKNIEYVKKLHLLNEDEIRAGASEAVTRYRDYLTEELTRDDLSKPRRDYISNDLEYLENIHITSRYSKERFGKMLMLIIKNLAVKPSFSGYTDNWKDEFFGNAIEKVLLYSHNFDENLLSKRTGKKSKAFAYITQICFNAFLAVINDRNKEQKQLKDMIPYETIDGFKPYVNNEVTKKEEDVVDNHVFTVEYYEGLQFTVEEQTTQVEDDEDIVDFFEFQLNYVERENAIYEKNDIMKREIEAINKTTPQEERNRDYIMYIRELEDKIQPCEFIKPIRTIKIIYSENMEVTEEQLKRIFDIKPSHIGIEITKHRTKREKVIYKDPEAALIFDTEFDMEFQEEEW